MRYALHAQVLGRIAIQPPPIPQKSKKLEKRLTGGRIEKEMKPDTWFQEELW